MSKWFEVKVTTVVIYVVEVGDNENEDKATDVALNDWTMSGNSEAEAVPIQAAYIETCKRHAGMVRTLDGEGDKG